MGGEGQQINPEPLEGEATLGHKLGGIAMDDDAALAAGPSDRADRLQCTHLALGCNQGNQSGWSGQQPIELIEPQYALPINGPFGNAPAQGVQLVRRSDHRRMLHRRDHQPARDKTGGTAEQGKVHGFRRP